MTCPIDLLHAQFQTAHHLQGIELLPCISINVALAVIPGSICSDKGWLHNYAWNYGGTNNCTMKYLLNVKNSQRAKTWRNQVLVIINNMREVNIFWHLLNAFRFITIVHYIIWSMCVIRGGQWLQWYHNKSVQVVLTHPLAESFYAWGGCGCWRRVVGWGVGVVSVK